MKVILGSCRMKFILAWSSCMFFDLNSLNWIYCKNIIESVGIFKASKDKNFCKGITLTFDIFILNLSNKLEIESTKNFTMFFRTGDSNIYASWTSLNPYSLINSFQELFFFFAMFLPFSSNPFTSLALVLINLFIIYKSQTQPWMRRL